MTQMFLSTFPKIIRIGMDNNSPSYDGVCSSERDLPTISN